MRQLKLMSTAEVACRLGRPERTVRYWLAAGRLRGQRVGRSWVVEVAAVAELQGKQMGARRA